MNEDTRLLLETHIVTVSRPDLRDAAELCEKLLATHALLHVAGLGESEEHDRVIVRLAEAQYRLQMGLASIWN